jgi:nicotinamide-nucleotide amidase
LSAFGEDEVILKQKVDEFAQRIIERVGSFFVIDQDIALEKAILDKMADKELTLSVAESCTGGYLSHLFTQHPGSSRVFFGGGITYSYELKESVLGVKPETLYQYGAVSEQTAKEMVQGALLNFKSDFAIAITGIAGPDGGTEDKPVGTVWIAAANKDKMLVKKYTFGSKRRQNIERSAIAALSMLNTLLT